MSTPALCPWDPSTFLIFSSNVPTLHYYSHIPAIIAALLMGIFVFRHQSKSMLSSLLLILTTTFALYTFFDSILWATNRSDVVIFFWSLQILMEVAIYFIGWLFTYYFVHRQMPPFKVLLTFSALLAPFVILVSTQHNLEGVYLPACTAIESFVARYYSYGLEIFFSIGIIFTAIKGYFKVSAKRRKAIVYFTVGILAFLLALVSGNLIGSFTGNWTLAQAGFLGMPIFIAFLVFMIVQLNTFNIKMAGAQALVFAVWISVLGILFVRTIENVRIITSLTLILVLVLGTLLVRSVKREVQQRERIQKLADDLQNANERLTDLDKMKTEFLSLATHQIRSPLAAIKGYASMIMEGDYGKIPKKVYYAAKTICDSTQGLVKVVQDFLDISRLEQGQMKYDMEEVDLKVVAKKALRNYQPNIEEAGLGSEFESDESVNYNVQADRSKISQVVGNLIDNAVKYTPKGEIKMRMEREDGKIILSVSDTGVGMKKEEIKHLFQKFTRTEDAFRTNVSGTGLGLFVARQMVEAMNGSIRADSEGKQKGSTFTIEMPASKNKKS